MIDFVDRMLYLVLMEEEKNGISLRVYRSSVETVLKLSNNDLRVFQHRLKNTSYLSFCLD